MIRVLLSLDLNDASREQRDDLYEILKGKNWKKAKHVDTVWTLTYPDYDHDSEDDFKKIRDYLAKTFRDSAEKLGLKEIYYVAQLGNESVISRVVKKVDGKHKVLRADLYDAK